MEVSFGGEAGIFYFVPLIATWCNTSVFDAAWWFLCMQVTVGAIASSTALLTQAETWLGTGMVVVGIAGLATVSWIISDVYVIYFFTVSFLPWLLVLLQKKHYRSLLGYSFLLGLVYEYGNFVRSFSGLPLLMGFLVAVMFSLRNSRNTFLAILLFCAGSMCVKMHIHKVLSVRNAYLKEHKIDFLDYPLQHTFWHNIYMGFGFITNNRDIVFSDECSLAKVNQLNPQARYLDSLYETALKNEVLRLCFLSPNFVLRVFFAKLGVLFYYLLLFANIGLIAAYYAPKPLYVELSYWSMMLIGALPGLLTIPNMLYLLGFCSTASLYGIHSLIFYLNKKRL